MSGVFQNIDPPPSHRTPPPLVRGGGQTCWVEMGRGVKSSEDARHCSVYSIYVSTLCMQAYERMLENETHAKAYRQR
jgi:hypothetical protein